MSMSALVPCSRPGKSLFHVIYAFSLSVILFMLPYCTSKLFCFLRNRRLIYPCRFSANKSVEFSFVILEGPVLFALLNPFPDPLLSPILFNVFFAIVSSDFSAVALFFLFHYVLAYFSFFTSFACRNFFICLSSLISHRGFVFLFGFLGEITLSLTSSGSAYIWLFSSVMLLVEILDNNLFTFSVSALILFRSKFLIVTQTFFTYDYLY